MITHPRKNAFAVHCARSGTDKLSRTARSKKFEFDSVEFLETAAKGRTVFKHSKKHLIFAQGQPANAVFYIKKGKVKVSVVSKHGKEAVIAILGADEFLGEGCLIGSQSDWRRRLQ